MRPSPRPSERRVRMPPRPSRRMMPSDRTTTLVSSGTSTQAKPSGFQRGGRRVSQSAMG